AATTTRWTRAADASAGGTGCRRVARSGSSRPPRQEEALEPLQRRVQLVALDGAGGGHVLRTDLGAFADERAAPDALVLRQESPPLPRPLVARVEVVPLGQRDGGRPEELRVQAVDRAGGVAQHAVDAHAVLLVLVQLFRRLPVLALRQRLLLGSDDP